MIYNSAAEKDESLNDEVNTLGFADDFTIWLGWVCEDQVSFLRQVAAWCVQS